MVGLQAAGGLSLPRLPLSAQCPFIPSVIAGGKQDVPVPDKSPDNDEYIYM